MLLWGTLLVVVFVVPLQLDPELQFHWNTILDGAGKAKLEPLLIAITGLLSLVVALIPSSPPPRGLLAGTLGLLGIALPNLLALGDGEIGLATILTLVGGFGAMLLAIGNLIRSEYRDATLPRILVTLGVLCVLAFYLVPVNGELGLMATVTAIVDAEGKAKVVGIGLLLPLVYAALSLLVWLPAPSGGLGKLLAWLWITIVMAMWLLARLTSLDTLPDEITTAPYHALLGWLPTTAFGVLLAYGFATILGKQLE